MFRNVPYQIRKNTTNKLDNIYKIKRPVNGDTHKTLNGTTT